jgi:hypothetical protein
MKPELIEEIECMLEIIQGLSSGWDLPPGSNHLIQTPTGHLSVLHTSLLKQWANTLQKVIDSENEPYIPNPDFL